MKIKTSYKLSSQKEAVDSDTDIIKSDYWYKWVPTSQPGIEYSFDIPSQYRSYALNSFPRTGMFSVYGFAESYLDPGLSRMYFRIFNPYTESYEMCRMIQEPDPDTNNRYNLYWVDSINRRISDSIASVRSSWPNTIAPFLVHPFGLGVMYNPIDETYVGKIGFVAQYYSDTTAYTSQLYGYLPGNIDQLRMMPFYLNPETGETDDRAVYKDIFDMRGCIEIIQPEEYHKDNAIYRHTVEKSTDIIF